MLFRGQLPKVPKPATEAAMPEIPPMGGTPVVPPGASVEPIRLLGRKLSASPSWAERRKTRVDARNAEKMAGRAERRALGTGV
jgi:hypothetical protein